MVEDIDKEVIMAYTRVLMDDHLHEKMKQLAGSGKGALIEEYREAIRNHIENKTKENISRDSGLEVYFNERMSKMEKHLASMMARTGMDTSMNLMGTIELLSKLLKIDKEQIILQLRKDGAKYFSTAIKEDKENKLKELKKE